MLTMTMTGFLHTVDWPIHTDAVLFPDVERVLRSIRTAPNSEFGVSKRMVECRGDIWQVSSSYYHPFAAMATSDGWLKLNNPYHGHKRGEVSMLLLAYISRAMLTGFHCNDLEIYYHQCLQTEED
jgi:hypothetical protein